MLPCNSSMTLTTTLMTLTFSWPLVSLSPSLTVICMILFLWPFFSSPVHGVLKVSYCDQSLSVVRPSHPSVRPSTIVKKPISSETTSSNSMKLCRKFLGWPSTKIQLGVQLINSNNKMGDFLICFKNISETTRPDSLKLYRKLHCMTLWPTLLDICLKVEICWSWLICLWNIHCVKMCLNCNIFINALSQSCGPLLRWAF